MRHTSTGDDINPIGAGAGTATISAPGTEQFGLAINTAVGGNGAVAVNSRSGTLDMANVDDAVALADNGELIVDDEYDAGDGTINGTFTAEFAFLTDEDPELRVSDEIASTDGYTECKTVPVRYLANISPTTTSGTYTTTIVYSAVPTY